jgi:transcriptional regulator with XRE-family HTH domain
MGGRRAHGAGSPTPRQLGAAIRSVRAERGLTLEQLAARTEIHWSYLSYIENGVLTPSWKTLTLIAAHLEVRVSELARRAEDLAAT